MSRKHRGVAADALAGKRHPIVGGKRLTLSTRQGLEALEPRVLLSASAPGQVFLEPVSASGPQVLASALGDEVVYQAQTQYDNFFKPNVIAFDFAIDTEAVNGVIMIEALSDLDHPSESVAYNIEGLVTGELWTDTDDGVRPFTATINLSDADLAVLAADGNLHIEFTPNSNVDNFGDVSEFVTVGLLYELTSKAIVLTPVMPLISGSYRGSVASEIDYSGDVDTYTLDLEAGQTVRFEGVPDPGLSLYFSLADPNDSVLYTSGFAAPGAAILPQAFAVPEDGTYSIRVASGGALGAYALNVFVNEAIEEESIGGASNNNLAGAQSLDDQFRDLGGGMSRAVVRGSTTTYVVEGNPAIHFLLTESFESGAIPSGWAATSTGTGRVLFIDTLGGSDGAFAMVMDSSANNSYGNNEAIWTVDLPSDRQLTLSFDRITWSEGTNSLPTSYIGSRNGDGVSISDDGVNWYTVQNAWYNASPVWESTVIDLSAAATAAGMTLGPGFKIKFQQYDNYPITSEGRGYDNIVISGDANLVFPSPVPDYYKFTLEADQAASIQLNDPDGDPVTFRLYDPAGNLLTLSPVISPSGVAGLYDFKAPLAGVYAVEVTQGLNDYLLSVVLDGTIDNESNESIALAQRMDRTGAVVFALETSSNPDYYTVPVTAGDLLVFETATPDDGASGLNTLDPYLTLYDPSGAQVAFDDNGAADGRNALISHTALASGVYTVMVSAPGQTGTGTLAATGYTGAAVDPLAVQQSNIADNALLTSKPTKIDLTLDEAVLSASIQPGDLTMNGAAAVSATLLNDGQTVRFGLPNADMVQGYNTITLAGGSLHDLQGDPNEPFTMRFFLDSVAPTIIESSLLEGGVLPAGDVTITVKFSEPVVSTTMATGGHTRLNTTTVESAVSYNELTNELTVTYAGLVENAYQFTLYDFLSGSYIRDLAENILDGEDNSATTVPSGNGIAGGDFIVNFVVEDGTSQPLTLTDTPITPGGSFAYEGTFADIPNFVGDETRYTLDLIAGQDFTVAMTSSPSFVETEVELLDPLGAVVASSAGGPALLNAVPIDQSGTYTLLVRATYLPFPGLVQYTGSVLVNAVNEAEAVGGPGNDDLAGAQDLGPAFFSLGNGVEQAVVVGDNPVVTSEIAESFETGSLGPAWTTSSSGTTQYSRIQVTTAGGAADGSRALLMDTSSSSSGLVLNEAVWTVDLSGLEDAVLSFSHAEWNDESHSLPTVFTGSYNGDGVSISDDGVTWRSILSAPNTSSGVWTAFSVNLLEVAQSAGMTLGPDFKIKFQQYDDDPRSNDGRGYDNIRITGLPASPAEADYYRVDLEQDEWLSVTLAGEDSLFGKPRVQLFDAGGALVAIGSDDWVDASSAISGFRAPAAGGYFVRVPRGSGAYSLIVTRDATFSPEPVSVSTVLGIPSGKAVGAIDTGTDTDTFSFQANAGDSLVIWTETPGFDPLVAANTLDTFLELRGPDGYLQVEGGSGGDGLNALLNHTATQTGTYTVKVLSESQTTGGYVLNMTGQTGEAPAFEVVSGSIAEGATLTTVPTQLTVHLNAPVKIDTLDASDLTVNGLAATAVAATDANTLVFTLPDGLGDGVYSFVIAGGAIGNLSGTVLAPYALQATIDTQGPRVVSTSIQHGDVLEPGKKTVTIRFDEALSADILNVNDVQLRGPIDLVTKPIESFVYDPATFELTLVFNAVDEGSYRLTLVSSTSGFRDLAGNLLDGELPGGPIPDEVSGDGTPGGNFTIDFAVDRVSPAPIGQPQRLTPFGSLLSASRFNQGNLNGPDDEDPFTVFVQPGQILTAVLTPTYNSNASLTLSALGGGAVASEPGGPVVLTLPYAGPAQDVTLTVGGDTQTYYNLEIYINAAAEQRLTPAAGETAADLGPAFVNLPGSGASVVNILGTGQPARELTVLDKLFAPNTMNFNFTGMTAPTGDGTLTITARGDLDALDEFITLNGEGLLITALFVDDGGDNTIVTTTLSIPQADLAAMADNGTISFTATASAMVGNYADTFLTLSLDYPGAPLLPVDEYALDLVAGQVVSVFIDSDAGLFTVELIDALTGVSIAQGGDGGALFDQALRDFIVPATGRYIIRARVPAATDYRLSVIRGAASDFEPNDTPADPLVSLDDAGAASGFLQTPGAERLFAFSRTGDNIPTILELDPQTFSVINSFVPGAGINLTLGESDLAYDGQTLFITGSLPGTAGGVIFALSPDTGEVLSSFSRTTGSGYDIATYRGEIVTLSKSTNLTFIDSGTGAVLRELPIGVYADALVGAGPRGSIFVADTVSQMYTLIYEIDAVTGAVVNSFTASSPFATSLAFVDGRLFVTSSRSGSIEVYDPDTGNLVQVGGPFSTSLLTLGGDGVVPGSIVPDIDRYTLTLRAGERTIFTTVTPFDHPEGVPLNNLDPAIRVFDPNGVEIAFDDNGAADGKNATLTFTATVEGVYTVEVSSANGTGEYLLRVEAAPLLLGDLNGDGFVGIEDLNMVLSNWNQTVLPGNLAQGDVTGDGFIGIEDLSAVLGNWNATLPPLADQGGPSRDGFSDAAAPATAPIHASPTAAQAAPVSAASSAEAVSTRAFMGQTQTQRVHPIRHAHAPIGVTTHSPEPERPADTGNRAAIAAWTRYQRRADSKPDFSHSSRARLQDDSHAELGLWEH